MYELELRIKVYESLLNYVNSLMQNNNISAAMMEDALNKILCGMKDQVMREFLVAASQPPQQEAVQEEEINGEQELD